MRRLNAEISYLESSLNERDLKLFESLRQRLAAGRAAPLAELLNSPSARAWRVRLRALRRSPRYHELLAPHLGAPPLSSSYPLERLMDLSGGLVMNRARAKEREVRVLRPSDFTLCEPHLLMHSDDESLERVWVSEREAHNALAPSDVLILTKGVGLGVYLFPEVRRQELPTLAQLNMIVLRARPLEGPEAPALLHPAFIASWLTSAEGVAALAGLLKGQGGREEGGREEGGRTLNRSQLSLIDHRAPRSWALTLTDLRALRVPLPSPLRQAISVVVYCLSRELARQRAHLERARGALLRGAQRALCGEGRAEGWDVTGRDEELRAQHRAHLDALKQPLEEGAALRCDRLDVAPLYPTLSVSYVLRSLTRYLIALKLQREGRWRLLNVVVKSELPPLSPLTPPLPPAAPSREEEGAEREGALEDLCVDHLHHTLNDLKAALTVEDHALGLPSVKPEQWFRFVGARRHRLNPDAPPDLSLTLWVCAEEEGPSLGEALSLLSGSIATLLRADGAPTLSLRALVLTRLGRWRADLQGLSPALGGREGLSNRLLLIGVGGPPDEGGEVKLAALDSFALKGDITLTPADLARYAQEPLARLLESLRAHPLEHLAHLATLEEQLVELLGARA